MSADVVGNTALYEALGDARAREIVADCLATLKNRCSEYHGRVIAEVGDEVMALFSDPTEAASAASDIHVDLNDKYANDDERNIRLQIGLHYGPLPKSSQLSMSETTKIAS